MECLCSDLHADVPGTPDNGAQVADGHAVAHKVDVASGLGNRSGHEADSVDDVVRLNLGHGAVLALYHDAAVLDLTDGALEIDGHTVEHQRFAQEAGVRQRDHRGSYEIHGVFNHGRVLALVHELQRGLAAGLAAAEDYDLVAGLLLLTQQLGQRHALVEAGDGHRARHGAGGDYYLVEAAECAYVVYLGVEAHLYAGLFDLAPVPVDELLVVLLKGHARGRDEQSAEGVGLFENHRRVPALFQHEGALHASDAAADDGDLLRPRRRDDLVLVVLHGLRGQRAAREVHRIVHALQVDRALVLGHVEAAVVAADAGLDLLLAALLQLVDPLVVDKVLAGDGDGVDLAFRDGFRGNGGFHLAGTYHRDIAEVLNVLDFGKVAVVRHVLRRMRPVPGVVGAVVAVEHVVAGVLQLLDHDLALGHVAAELDKLLAGHRALEEVLRLGDNGVAQGYGEVAARGVLYVLDDICGEAQSVVQAAAVLVRAPVEVLDGELVKRIALVHRVDLNAVNAGLTQQPRGLAEGLGALLDFGNGERTGLVVLLPAVRRGRGAGSEVVGVHDKLADLAHAGVVEHHAHDVVHRHRASAADGELHEQLRAGLVEVDHVVLQLGEHLLVGVNPAVAHDVAHPLHAGQDKAHIVLRGLEQEVSRLLVEVAGLHPAEEARSAHGAHDKSVFDFHIADFPGGKQSAVLLVHQIFLSFIVNSKSIHGDLPGSSYRHTYV